MRHLMTHWLTRALACLALAACDASQPPPSPATDDEALVRAIINEEQLHVEAFFAAPMPRPFELRIFPHRTAMEEFARKTWQMPELPCWAVAMGSGSTLAVLAPSVWSTEACEHDARDAHAMHLILAHELVHVFHGQRRTDSEFMQADEVAWFVEGLAVHASGQLDAARMRQAQAAAASGKGPTRLAEAWSGAARYGIAGSMVRFMEERIGRAELITLLGASTNEVILARLGMSEAEFLAAWQTWLSARSH